MGGGTGGIGDLINVSQRRGTIENVILILLIIPVVALIIDRLFFFVQAELFPYRYGGTGCDRDRAGGTHPYLCCGSAAIGAQLVDE